MPHTLKQVLEKLSSEKAPGPSPTFSALHLLHAIELISEKTIGRGKLAQKLNVGEGAIRTLIERLKNADLITTSKTGCSLTSKGMKLWREYATVVKKVEIGKNELTLANYNFAILIRKHGNKIKSGMEQRDAAVRAGAKGATTILFRKGRLMIPSASENVAKDFPEAANQIFGLLKPEENDVIIIGSADNLADAEYGTLAAMWTLINDC
ncbi:MAG: DUF4443 domain-containing protein [Candidatus Bathyarchaeota archaeon]|jgi:predicted transcriptional regulator|nr:DUF4443 domain-containing protein [Candidatus Bathyarchaeota archaeon A05DMB-5]MDH7557486.1 DUF4443 domain-containing protein [Candidatus Bathyarchaeota archaeon]